MNFFPAILQNKVLIACVTAWALAQMIKLPLEYFRSREWKWDLILQSGGMPSSHSALITSTALATGLFEGFDSTYFGIAVAVAFVVIYDAVGVRRQSGIHAQRINVLFDELLHKHTLNQDDLREVLGHTPLEVVGGILLGITVATTLWLIWN
jgi:acid phosphatase family membrane protein YuiD